MTYRHTYPERVAENMRTHAAPVPRTAGLQHALTDRSHPPAVSEYRTG